MEYVPCYKLLLAIDFRFYKDSIRHTHWSKPPLVCIFTRKRWSYRLIFNFGSIKGGTFSFLTPTFALMGLAQFQCSNVAELRCIFSSNDVQIHNSSLTISNEAKRYTSGTESGSSLSFDQFYPCWPEMVSVSLTRK